MVKTRTSSLAVAPRVATGTYTGDGAATQAVVGVGFQPRFVYIIRNVDSTNNVFFKITQDLLLSIYFNSGATQFLYGLDEIISLDPDGFTVGDSTPNPNLININGTVYTYFCFG